MSTIMALKKSKASFKISLILWLVANGVEWFRNELQKRRFF